VPSSSATCKAPSISSFPMSSFTGLRRSRTVVFVAASIPQALLGPGPFQRAAAERSLSPRVIAASDTEVVVHWCQRGLSPAGDHIDTPVLGLYRLRDAKLTRAQMFYFDPLAVVNFLAKAGTSAVASAAP
jgi:hypothetical protein